MKEAVRSSRMPKLPPENPAEDRPGIERIAGRLQYGLVRRVLICVRQFGQPITPTAIANQFLRDDKANDPQISPIAADWEREPNGAVEPTDVFEICKVLVGFAALEKRHLKFVAVRWCEVCGCTELHACQGGCYWARTQGGNVCNRCADRDVVEAAIEDAEPDGGGVRVPIEWQNAGEKSFRRV